MSFLRRDISDPTPELDPESAGLDETAATNRSSATHAFDDEIGSEDAAKGKVKRRKLRYRAPLEASDTGKYSGQKVSRRALHGHEEDEEVRSRPKRSRTQIAQPARGVARLDLSDGGKDGENASDGDDLSPESEPEGEADLEVRSQLDLGDYSPGTSEAESSDRDDENGIEVEFEEEDRGEDAVEEAAGDEEEMALQLKIEEMRKAEVREVQRLREVRQKELERASAVKEQKALYDSLLRMRIRLQRVVQVANRMPEKNHELRNEYGEKLAAAQQALLTLGQKMLRLHSLVSDAGLPKAGKADPTSAEELCKAALHQWEQSAEWRREQLTYWSDRSAEARGLASRTSGFKALNQSAVAQIENVLSDRERLLKRTRMKRAPVAVFGGASVAASEYDPEIFDDNDFYQQLVREIIDGGEHGKAGDSIQVRQHRLRKTVDRRASKGRKLRYHAHEKLVGFLAPRPFDAPPALDELVAGLFKS